ncbi:MAG: aminoglycoside phosphotransferase family protein [Candidatus Dojkabacteria bacterium]|nr:aminoglycoside phosphotransferase family protein [Candidatus Dojkabacteria bacterium]
MKNYSWALVTEVLGKALLEMSPLDLRVLKDAGADLAKLHTISADGFGYVREFGTEGKPIGEDPSYSYHLMESLRYKAPFSDKLDVLKKFNLLKEKEIYAIVDFIDSNKKYIEIEHGVLMHGDYSKDHIFYKNNKYSGVIDWDGIGVGTGIYDLAQFSIQNTKKELDALLEGYLIDSKYKDDSEFRERLFIEELLFVIPKLAKIKIKEASGQRYMDNSMSGITLNNFERVIKRFRRD